MILKWKIIKKIEIDNPEDSSTIRSNCKDILNENILLENSQIKKF